MYLCIIYVCIYLCTYVWKDGWMGGFMHAYMYEWMGWMDMFPLAMLNVYVYFSCLHFKVRII